MVEAWEVRRRPGWPLTFHEAMKSPMLSRLILLEALHGEAMRVAESVGRHAQGDTSPNDRETLKSGSGGSAVTNGDGQRYWWQDRD